MTKMCCVCRKVEEGGRWSADRIFAEDEQVTHGYCPECYAAVIVEIQDFIGEKVNCAQRAPAWSPAYGSCRPCA